MGNEKIRFQFIHFKGLVIIFIAITVLFWSYIVIGQTTGERYIEVDQNIWSSAKYLVLCLIAVLVWIGLEMIWALKKILVQVAEQGTTLKVTQIQIESIEGDVREINNKTEKQEGRILQLEKAQRN